MKVLIGIISKNRASILPKAIQSALKQNLKHKAISVFDDHSTDDTSSLVKQYPEVNWFFSKKDLGYVYGRNKLMREANAEYYCSLDDDYWFIQEDELSIACNYLDEHPDVAAIAYEILSPDRPNKAMISEPIETNLFIGCGHVLRLSHVKEVGYYVPFPGFYAGEERDLCIRLIDKGFKIVKLPGIYVWHDKTMISRNVQQQCMSNVCNDLAYAFIRFPLKKMLISIPHKIILHLKHSKRNKLVIPCLKGIYKFFLFLLSFRLIRNPVSIDAFEKFQKLY